MDDRLPIVYRDFYDVPRMFVVVLDDSILLFDGSFDDDLDDYPEHYHVYRMPHRDVASLPESWLGLAAHASADLGELAVSSVAFDATKRQSVPRSIVAALAAKKHTPVRNALRATGS